MIETQYLIIGSGVAGLTLAIKLATGFPDKKITIVTKSAPSESNTKYAQGGIATVLNIKEDSFKKHIEDTLRAGDGLCDRVVVEKVVKQGPDRIKELMQWGANFDKDSKGKFMLGREGGHSENRVIHSKDSTGNEIERTLLARVENLQNVRLLPHHFAVDLITDSQHKGSTPGACCGAYVLDQISGTIITLKANSTILASGGLGMVYGHTTNPAVATGDGVAMAYRAKAAIKNMEFIQFHPTAFYDGKNGASFLISEAVRGFGAYLRNRSGERFMFKYDVRGELASRDVVSRAIAFELENSGDESVFLDCTHLKTKEFQHHFPGIYTTCLRKNIDVSTHWIPVVPAAHYLCGGIAVDIYGRTSIANLFACGECSHTGLHGANRLASNSLLEALVYADSISDFLIKNPSSRSTMPIPEWIDRKSDGLEDPEIIQQKILELQKLMRNYAGVIRSTRELQRAFFKLEELYIDVEGLFNTYNPNTAYYELRNMVNVSYLIVQQSLNRRENRGGYYNKNNLKNIKQTL